MTYPKKKKADDSAKHRLLPLFLLLFLFYGIMFVLTFTAKDIHNARLPHVTAGPLSRQDFEYMVTPEGGMPRMVTSSLLAIPKELVDSEQVFVIYTEERNGMTYTYARKVFVTVSLENDMYYSVDGGIAFSDRIILSGYEELEDGCEVYIVKQK